MGPQVIAGRGVLRGRRGLEAFPRVDQGRRSLDAHITTLRPLVFSFRTRFSAAKKHRSDAADAVDAPCSHRHHLAELVVGLAAPLESLDEQRGGLPDRHHGGPWIARAVIRILAVGL